MNDSAVINIAVQTLIISAKICGPILLVSLAIGLGVSIIQAATQIQEFTLTFVPKLVGVAIVIVVSGNWMLAQLVAFTKDLFALIPSLIRS